MTLRMPAEWTEHERCLMAWPTRAELWGDGPGRRRGAEYAAGGARDRRVRAGHHGRPPGAGRARRRRPLRRGGRGARAADRRLLVPRLRTRSSCTGPDGERAGVDFRFNSWGEKHLPWDTDDADQRRCCSSTSASAAIASSMILEGGAITVDGEGTLITTEQCLLHPNRNPGLTKDADRGRAEGPARRHQGDLAALRRRGRPGHRRARRRRLRVRRPGPGRWCRLPRTRSTPTSSGCAPTAPSWRRRPTPRAAAGDHRPAAERVRRGRRASAPRSATSTSTWPTAASSSRSRTSPTRRGGAGRASPPRCPDRKVVGVRARVIAFGGGGVHCITQQVPVAGAAG